jgi:hypothetical protein
MFIPAICSVEVGRTNQIELGIDPIDLLHDQVQCQTVGPPHGLRHDRRPVGAIHPGSFYSWLIAPIRPEHPPNNYRGQT